MAAPAIAAAAGRLGISKTAIGKVFQAGNLFDGLNKTLPTLEEEIDVRVYGNRKATKVQLYRLAMAFVWGKIQRRDTIRALPPPGMLLLEYNLESNSVRVVARQVTNYLTGLVSSVARSRRTIELFEGPPNTYRGGSWAWTSAIPGVPGGVDSGLKTPVNGFEGRVIMTADPTYRDAGGNVRVSRSPTPAGDHISRGISPVTADPTARGLDPFNWNNNPDYLLYAALSEPCAIGNLYSPVTAPTPPTTSPPKLPTGGEDGGAPTGSQNQPPQYPPQGTTNTQTQNPPVTVQDVGQSVNSLLVGGIGQLFGGGQ